MANRGPSIDAEAPAFKHTPIHNQTLDRWAEQIDPEITRKILRLAIKMSDPEQNRQSLSLAGPILGSIADEIQIAMDHAYMRHERPMFTRRLHLNYTSANDSDEDDTFQFDRVCIRSQINKPATDVLHHKMTPEVRLFAAIQLHGYVEGRNRWALRDAGMFLTPTGIVTFCLLHGVMIKL